VSAFHVDTPGLAANDFTQDIPINIPDNAVPNCLNVVELVDRAREAQDAKDSFYSSWQSQFTTLQENIGEGMGIFASDLSVLAANIASVPAAAAKLGVQGIGQIGVQGMGDLFAFENELSLAGVASAQAKVLCDAISQVPSIATNFYQAFLDPDNANLAGMLQFPSAEALAKDPTTAVTDWVGHVAGAMGNLGSLVSNAATVYQAIKTVVEIGGPAGKLLNAVPGLNVAMSVITAATDVYDSYQAIQAQIGPVQAAEQNYQNAVNRFRSLLAQLAQAEQDCDKQLKPADPPTPPTTPGPLVHLAPGRSDDPNNLASTGFGPQGFVSPSDQIGYTIDFENDPTATLPAQQVTITDQLPSGLDWSTVQLTGIGFNGVDLSLPAGVSNYNTTTNVSIDPTHPVDVQVTFDPTTGLLTWTLTSVDPGSGMETQDPVAGFLPPDNAQGQGEGFVSFTAMPAAGLTTGTPINDQATVVFDTNAPINTPTVTNTIDAGPPTSSVAPLPASETSTLPASETSTSFQVSWSGQDDKGGSGIASYNIYVSDDGGPFTLFQGNTTEPSATFTGQDGHTYAFYSVATDNVGNVEPTPLAPEATTLVLLPPNITSAAHVTFTVGNAGEFTVTTAAYAPAALTETGTLPQGVTFVDNGDGTATLSGTPAATTGEYIFDITATTPDFPPVTQTFVLAVIDPPSITSPTGTIFTAGQAASFAITTTPGIPATTTLSESGKLPSGVLFKPGSNGTATLSGTPAAGSGGVYHFTINAGNAASSVTTQAFTLTVNPLGQAPSLPATGTATFTEGVMDSVTITATPGSPANTTLALAKGTTLPKGLSFKNNGNSTATISGTPATNTGGSYRFGVIASNAAGLMATETFTLLIDQAPVIASAATATFVAGQANSFIVTTNGLPVGTVAVNPPTSLPAFLKLTDNPDGSATLSGSPTAANDGQYVFTLTAKNDIGTSVPQTFTLTVGQAPSLPASGTAIFTEGVKGSVTITAMLGSPAETTLAMAKGTTLPKGLSFKDNGNNTATISGTPAANTGGSYSFGVTAGNAAGLVATETFTLLVDQAPAITSAGTATFIAGQANSFTVTARGLPTGTFTVTSLPAFLTLTDHFVGSATLSNSSTAAPDGQYTFTVTSSNAIGSASQMFTLTVAQAPSLPVTGTATFTEGVKGSVTITATPGSPAKTTLALAKGTTLPKGLSFKDNGNNTATISGAPAAKTGGSYSFSVIASNAAGLMGTEYFTLLIDQAPAITSAAGATFTAGTAGNFTITTTGYPAAALTEIGPLPAGVSLADNQDGTATLRGTPAAGTAGVYTFTVKATNGVPLATSQPFKLTVNQPPIITGVNTAGFTIGQADSFNVATAGFPTATLSESGKLPKGVAFKTGGKGAATLSGTPAAGSGGTYLFTITAGNGVSPESFQLFTLTVAAAESGNNTVTATIDSPAVNSPPSTVTVATAASPAAAPSLGATSTNGRATDAALRALLLDDSTVTGKPRPLFEP
jgi:hypothetical protein